MTIQETLTKADQALDSQDDSKAVKLYRNAARALEGLAFNERDPIMAHTLRDDAAIYASIANQIDQSLHREVYHG